MIGYELTASQMVWWLPLLSLALSGMALSGLLRYRAMLPVDHPNDRSLHVRPTPRIGGLGIMSGLGVAILLLPHSDASFLVWLAFGLSALSLVDDFRGLSVRIRFGVHVLVAFLALYVLVDLSVWYYWLWVPALIWMTNLYNFMDGSDGLAGGMALFGFGFLGLAAWYLGNTEFATLALIISAAAAGFLFFNFPPARVFMGDSGSIPLGLLAGGLGLAGWSSGLWPIVFPILVFSPFVLDASLTLLRRLLRGEKVWLAHRSHYYQRLVLMGWSHRRLAVLEYALMIAVGVSGLAVLQHPDWQTGVLVSWVAIYCVMAVLIDRRWKEFSRAN